MMAELILTDKEKEAESYLEWDHESLGKLVHKTALFFKDERGHGSVCAIAISELLAGLSHEFNSTNTTVEIAGLSVSGIPAGDWEITIKKVSK